VKYKKNDIPSFIWLLNEQPQVFLPTSWRDLPNLAEEIAKLANDETAIAQTIKDWCVERGLGETLRDAFTRQDIEDAGEPTPNPILPATNITQILRQEIEAGYQKLQASNAETRSNADNESK
jgi:hypothetical protein